MNEPFLNFSNEDLIDGINALSQHFGAQRDATHDALMRELRHRNPEAYRQWTAEGRTNLYRYFCPDL
ncbi:MAG TPA: hypothetical protein VGD78_20955 [Chthoniobacterales bacterium]